MNENPTGDQPQLTKDGEVVPPKDLLIGELTFGITEDSIRAQALKRAEDATILEEEGIDKILAELRNLYDTIKGFEAAGLRGKALDLTVYQDEKLLNASKRYYGFARGRAWGYRLQGVWIAGW